LDIEKGILQTDANSSSVDAALDKKAGIHKSMGIRSTPVLAAYAPFTWNKVTWAVVAEVDQAEVNAPIHRLRTQIIICGILCSIAAFVLGWLLAERKSIPLLSVGDMDLAR